LLLQEHDVLRVTSRPGGKSVDQCDPLRKVSRHVSHLGTRLNESLVGGPSQARSEKDDLGVSQDPLKRFQTEKRFLAHELSEVGILLQELGINRHSHLKCLVDDGYLSLVHQFGRKSVAFARETIHCDVEFWQRTGEGAIFGKDNYTLVVFLFFPGTAETLLELGWNGFRVK
jgi:hypothetical protein